MNEAAGTCSKSDWEEGEGEEGEDGGQQRRCSVLMVLIRKGLSGSGCNLAWRCQV